MQAMFRNATNFNQDISNWNVSNVTNMTAMFRNSTNFNSHIELWTVSSTNTLTDMFRDATAMNSANSSRSTFNTDGNGTPSYQFFNQSSPYCILEGTLVETDQGIIKIELINKKGYSINGVPIIGISKDFYKRKRLILFKKNCLGINIPNNDTYISEAHQIHYNNEFLTCKIFMNKYPELNLKYIYYDYTPTVYNLLCEKYIMMKCNNILMETLDHCHKDKLYKIKLF